MVARSFELACSTGLVMGSTMLIKELVLPKMRFSMPDIIYGFKALMSSLRASSVRVSACIPLGKPHTSVPARVQL